jgi:hypothetical protein
MSNTQRVAKGGFLLGLIAFASACVVATPSEGYYDRDHHRYYHEHTWHECGDRDRDQRCH